MDHILHSLPRPRNLLEDIQKNALHLEVRFTIGALEGHNKHVYYDFCTDLPSRSFQLKTEMKTARSTLLNLEAHWEMESCLWVNAWELRSSAITAIGVVKIGSTVSYTFT